ncbi:MAG: pyruvate dehydrogenase complex E1 component subunit beta [Actinobacteria bacterium]|nr:pyruvate dehydrogenase complex E1 component subunit beta [Actinomycetota bacterium]
MKSITLRQAINEALAEEMARDGKVFLMGEDIATGGAYSAVTEGLPQKVGANRIINTPISESCFTGAALGAALRGYRPVIEYMLGDFYTVAADQIINQIAKARYMSGGKVYVPITFRLPTGGYMSQASQHSQSPETIYIHTPGIKVVYPSGAYSAKGLLKSAIRDDNPVAFMEPKVLYEVSEEVPEEEYLIAIGKSNIVQKGSDLTLVAYGYQVTQAKKAIQALPDYSIELIDLLSLDPLDLETVLSSVSKTSRLLLVQEDYRLCSISEHIAYEVYTSMQLKSKIGIVSAKFAPVPFSPPLEKYLLPQVEDIIEAIKNYFK